MEIHFGPGPRRAGTRGSAVPSLFTVTSHQFAQQVLTDSERFSSAGYATTIGQVMGRTILQMDPPEHQRHRALVARAFRARVLDQWSDTIIGATVSELIDAFAGDGHADLVPQLTFPFPVRVIARILGLPEADWPRFLRLSTELIAVMRQLGPRGRRRPGAARLLRRDHRRPAAAHPRRPGEPADRGRGRRAPAAATTRSFPSCCCSCPPGRRRPTGRPATCCSACSRVRASWTRSAPTGTWCRRRSRRRCAGRPRC